MKSNILLIIFVLTVIISTIFSYYRYVIKEDIYYETDEELFQESLLEDE